MRRLLISAVLALAPVAMLASPASRADAKETKAAAKLDQAKVEKIGRRLKVLMAALDSPKVALPVKNALFMCIIGNSMEKISDAMDQAVAVRPVDESSADQTLAVMASICGYRPDAPDEGRPSDTQQ